MRVLVVGGRGFLGRKVMDGLALVPGCEAVPGGRSPAPGGVRVDLGDPSTFAAMDGFDAVVNCSDTVTAPPDAAVSAVLERGGVFVETGSEPLMARRLIAAFRSGQGRGPDGARGTVLLGAGLFTGLSNLLAGEAARRARPCRDLRLAIGWSPLSAGGGGMVNLVGHLLHVPTWSYRDGARVVGPSAEDGAVLPFASGPRRTLHVAFAEAEMLRLSTSAPGVAVYAALRPALLRPAFLSMPERVLKSRWMRAWLWLQFTALRRFLLRWRESDVEMVAVARPEGGGPEVVLRLRADDGMGAAGVAAAAMVRRLLAPGGSPGPGLHMPDECFRLDDVLADARALGGPGAGLRLEGTAGDR